MFSLSLRFASIALATIVPLSAQIRPAATKNVDEPGRIPYQVFFKAARGEAACGLNFCSFLTANVPANKRLVITNIAMTINLEAGAIAQAIKVAVQDATTSYVEVYLPYNPNVYPSDPISYPVTRRYAVNESVRMYAEAGQRLYIAFRTSGGYLVEDWPQLVLISGYLIDLTQ